MESNAFHTTVRACSVIGLLLPLALRASAPPETPPAWAYPINPPNAMEVLEDVPLHVQDSDATYSVAQILDLNFTPDWHPTDHTPMPDIVARGRKPDVLACGSCHRAAGSGGPENARIAGLPTAYIVQQLLDFRSGARNTSVSGRNPDRMINLAKAMTNDEIEAAATYFSAQRPRAANRVVETAQVPKTFIVDWHLAVAADGRTEPLGKRIVEVPDNLVQFASRDGRARIVVYVPVGSVARGRKIALSDGGKTTACAACHGPDLKGLGPIPGIAGRSPSYLMRQLCDFRDGARAGSGSALMMPVIKKLSMDDMIAAVAYAASLDP